MARRRRNPEIIAGRVNADGSIAAGDGFTVRTAGTGVYVVTFPAAFRIVSATGSPATAGTNRAVDVSINAAGEVVVNLFVATTFALENNKFNFTAVGVQQ